MCSPSYLRRACASALAAFLVATASASADLVISEFLADNGGTNADRDGDFTDWIELSNTGETQIDTDGYFLTDDPNDLTKFRLPSRLIAGGGYLVVFASAKDRAPPAGEIHANFSLDKDGDYLALVMPDGGTIRTEFAPTFPPQREDISYGTGIAGDSTFEQFVRRAGPLKYLVPVDDSLGLDWSQAPADFDDSGWPDATAGIGYENAGGPLEPLINTDIRSDMLGTNTGVYLRFPFQFDATDRAVISLQLTVTIDDGFVAYLNGTEVGSFGRPDPLAWNSASAASRQDDDVIAEPIVIDISAHAGSIRDGANVLAIHGMTASPGTSDFAIDLDLGGLILDTAPGLGLGFFDEPTPGAPNGTRFFGFALPPEFSARRGFYDGPFELALSSSEPGASIRYSTDGTTPTPTSGLPYVAPIQINGTTVVRAAAFLSNHEPSETVAHSYIFGNGAIRSLPIVSVSTDHDNLWGTTGIMETNPRNTIFRGIEWERPATAEWFEADGSGGFGVNCGLRIQGGNHIRARYDPNAGLPASKYSFRLYFRGRYGPTKLRYPLFKGSEIDVFDKIVLRAGMNDPVNPFVVDEMVRRMQIATGNVASRGTFAHYFLNGELKGYYNPTERIDDDFLRSWHGGDNDWDVIAQFGEIREGDAVAWEALKSLTNGNDQSVLANYQATERELDIDNFIDYLLVNCVAGTGDWPHNNWRAARERVPGAKFRFYVWDAEFAFGKTGRSFTVNTLTSELGGGTEIGNLYQRLRQSPEFRLRWADRVHKHLFNGGALEDDRLRAMYEEMRAQLSEAIPNMSGIIPNWIGQRRDIMMGHFLAADLHRSDNAPVLDPHGGRVSAGYNLRPTNVNGDVYITTDGSDPRLPGGAVSPSAVQIDGSTIGVSLVPAGSDWRYLDDDSDLGSSAEVAGAAGFGPGNWKHPDFDDSGWGSGPAPLGYGGVGEPTVIVTTVEYGDNVGNRHVTTYFRREFEVEGAALYTSLSIDLLKDDGAILYINGHEVARRDMPVGPVSSDTLATKNVAQGEDAFQRVEIDPTVLVEGTNVIAVELHQGTNSSSDLGIEAIVSGVRVNDEQGAVPIDGPALVKARSLDPATGEWSAVTEAFFTTGFPAAPGELAVTELHYHPLDPTPAETAAGFLSDEDFEFVEIMNIGDRDIDLASLVFADGIEFQLPPDGGASVLAAGERAVIVSNRAAFEFRYASVGPIRIVGEYSGNLQNQGENLRIESPEGATLLEFEYFDSFPWPDSADGDGYSLVLIAPPLDPSQGANWRPSRDIGGNPGDTDSVALAAADPTEDLDRDGIYALLEHALGTSDEIPNGNGDLVAQVHPPGGLPTLAVFRYRRNLSADDVEIVVEISRDLETWLRGPEHVSRIDSIHNGDGTTTEVFQSPLNGENGFYYRLSGAMR